MLSYKVVYSLAATYDIDRMVDYIKGIYRLESGLRYVGRIREKLEALSYAADALPHSRRRVVQNIHPKAKTITIMNHKWTAVFHISEGFVIIDRILPSKIITE